MDNTPKKGHTPKKKKQRFGQMKKTKAMVSLFR
jgi:hypothetical protein